MPKTILLHVSEKPFHTVANMNSKSHKKKKEYLTGSTSSSVFLKKTCIGQPPETKPQFWDMAGKHQHLIKLTI